ncbi:unnamed protein product [Notodromas monacha]|uniref:Ubiquitin-conjugating enzyme E2 Z n=1 Tax=Notodromas monacha TaxID=399045 RepID=A0A7R9BL63_9CRUS|nr:unnamed protein product [Notodromas monacha]CAG0917518.1 unnamed protein product [Notodromas monacha]
MSSCKISSSDLGAKSKKTKESSDTAASPLDFEIAWSFSKTNWDPLTISPSPAGYSPSFFIRMKNDIRELAKDESSNIFVMPKGDFLASMEAVILGPDGTPYEGGFFMFLIGCMPDYPISPPRVRFLTTADGNVRFNPNLYKDGKVCVSTLGTWEGPPWTPAITLSTLLVTIQSLMTEEPLLNEPGFTKNSVSEDKIKLYNQFVQHETLRVAVVDNLRTHLKISDESPFKKVMVKNFVEHFDSYVARCESLMFLEGKKKNVFGARDMQFVPKTILAELHELKTPVSSVYENLKLDTITLSSIALEALQTKSGILIKSSSNDEAQPSGSQDSINDLSPNESSENDSESDYVFSDDNEENTTES